MANYIEDEIRKTLIELGTDFSNELIKDLVNELVNQGKVASGSLKDSFDFKLKGGIENFVIELISNHYIQYVNDGRRAGKFVPIEPLQSWMKIKSIDLKYTYPINLKIKEIGIKPTYFFDKVLSDSRLDKYTKKLEDVLGRKIEAVIDNIFYQSEFKTNK
jgi:hypothetical protein